MIKARGQNALAKWHIAQGPQDGTEVAVSRTRRPYRSPQVGLLAGERFGRIGPNLSALNERKGAVAVVRTPKGSTQQLGTVYRAYLLYSGGLAMDQYNRRFS